MTTRLSAPWFDAWPPDLPHELGDAGGDIEAGKGKVAQMVLSNLFK